MRKLHLPINPVEWINLCHTHKQELEKDTEFSPDYLGWVGKLTKDGCVSGEIDPQRRTWTGRLLVRNKPLQSIPTPLRKAVCKPDHIIVGLDWKSVQMWILACLSGDKQLWNDLMNNYDFYTAVAEQVGSTRSVVKPAILAFLNGEGSERQAERLPGFSDFVRNRWETAYCWKESLQTPTQTPDGEFCKPYRRMGYHVQKVESQAMDLLLERLNILSVERNISFLQPINVIYDELLFAIPAPSVERWLLTLSLMMGEALWDALSQICDLPFKREALPLDGWVKARVGPNWGTMSDCGAGKGVLVDESAKAPPRPQTLKEWSEYGERLSGGTLDFASKDQQWALAMWRLEAPEAFQAWWTSQYAFASKEHKAQLSEMFNQMNRYVHPYLLDREKMIPDGSETGIARYLYGKIGDDLMAAQPYHVENAHHVDFFAYDPESKCWSADKVYDRLYNRVQNLHGAVTYKGKSIQLTYAGINGVLSNLHQMMSESRSWPDQVADNRVVFLDQIYDPHQDKWTPLEKESYVVANNTLPYTWKSISNAQPTAFINFMHEVWKGCSDIEARIQLIREFQGACFANMATIGRRALFLKGSGRNGKGVLMECLKSCFRPDQVSTVKIHHLNDPAFAIALYGKRLNITWDASREDLRETAALKTAVGGEEISAHKLYHKKFMIKPTAGYIVGHNPDLKISEHATLARIVSLDFNRNFVKEGLEDPMLIQKLTTPENVKAMIGWAMEGLKQFVKNGYRYSYLLEKPIYQLDRSENLKEEQRINSDSTLLFLYEEVEPGKHGSNELYQRYKHWAVENGHTPVSNQTFKQRIVEENNDIRKVEYRRTNTSRMYIISGKTLEEIHADISF